MIPYGKSISHGKSLVGPGTRNIGADVTPIASQRAEQTSLGRTNLSKASIDNVADYTIPKPPTAGTGALHRGSLAGLRNSHSVHLVHNNSGYFNPTNQTARYSKKLLPSAPIPANIDRATKSSVRVLDSRPLKSGSGSIAKLLGKKLK